MPDELQQWWQNLNPQTQAAILDGGAGLGALLVGHLLGVLVRRVLSARDFDSLFRVTRSASDFHQAHGSFTPSAIAGHLVRLTVWAGAGWWLARRQEWPEAAATILTVLSRAWAVVGVLSGALVVAALLTRRVMECLDTDRAEAPVTARHIPHPAPKLAGPVGAAVYCLVILLALLTAVDYFEWPLTRTAATGLWQLAQNLLTAGAALLVGGLGARWARDAAARPAPSEDRATQYTSLAILGGTTAAAVGLLLFGAGLRIGVVLAAAVVVVLYLARGRMTDFLAGLRLRKGKVGTVWFEGTPLQVAGVGLLESEVGRGGEFFRVPNRELLQAVQRGAPAADNRAALTR